MKQINLKQLLNGACSVRIQKNRLSQECERRNMNADILLRHMEYLGNLIAHGGPAEAFAFIDDIFAEASQIIILI